MWWWFWLPSAVSAASISFNYCSAVYHVALISSYLLQRSESFIVAITTTTPSSTRNFHVSNLLNNDQISTDQQKSIMEKVTTRQKQRTWEESCELLISYKERYGNCNVPQRYKDDPRLGLWVNTQRRTKDKLSDERIVKLNDLGFSWTNEIYEEQWEECFQLLVSYKEKHGNCNVPNRYEDDLRLGNWVDTQRQGKEKLSDERIVKLDGLGFSWSNEIFEEQWEEMFQKLVLYSKENNGECNIPYNVDDDVNKELYKWVGVQRKRKSLLSEDRLAKLDNLGLLWEDVNKVKADQKWNEKFERLKNYKKNYGDCRVPQKWEEDLGLGQWVSNQRNLFNMGQLREGRKMKLEEMDFTWKARDGRKRDYVKLDLNWVIKFGTLLNFLEEHGHCNVPRSYKKNKSLGDWVNSQRKNKKNGTLRQDRKERLGDIGLAWSFDDQKDAQWNEKYKELIRFKEKNGHLRLPRTSRSLVDWVYQQRIQFAAGKVGPERKAMLDEIDFRWEIEK